MCYSRGPLCIWTSAHISGAHTTSSVQNSIDLPTYSNTLRIHLSGTGRVAKVARSVVAGLGPLRVALSLAKKLRYVLHLRIWQRDHGVWISCQMLTRCRAAPEYHDTPSLQKNAKLGLLPSTLIPISHVGNINVPASSHMEPTRWAGALAPTHSPSHPESHHPLPTAHPLLGTFRYSKNFQIFWEWHYNTLLKNNLPGLKIARSALDRLLWKCQF